MFTVVPFGWSSVRPKKDGMPSNTYHLEQGLTAKRAAQLAQEKELRTLEFKDLRTHAVCVGMTGSGKTGLCVGLLEEAAIDGIPTIAIDPKGDTGNLLLTFPHLRPRDSEPWVDPGVAAQKGERANGYAAKMAFLWKNGLAEWGQDGGRIEMEDVEELRALLDDMEGELREQIEDLEYGTQPDELELTERAISPRKSDISVTSVVLVWTPWHVNEEGAAELAYRWE